MDDLAAFLRVVPVLQRIDRGAGLCEDRKFGWTVDIEEREGRKQVADAFAAHPRLAFLMPELAERLATGRPLGSISSSDILSRAEAALRATSSSPAIP